MEDGKLDSTAQVEGSSSGRPKLGDRFSLHLDDAKAELEKAQREYQMSLEGRFGSETTETLRVRADAAEKRLRLVRRERDSSGAWKGERMGRDMTADFVARWGKNERGEIAIPRTKSGERVISKQDERAHFLVVNMGELDRLNSSGDHHLGDVGLALTFEKIESVVGEILAEAGEGVHRAERDVRRAFEVYRLSGNDFAVNLRDADPAEAERIVKRLNEERVSVEKRRPGEESIPLAASAVSREDALELLNALERDEGLRPDQVGLTDQRMLIEIMKEQAQTTNDIAKLKSRTGRLMEKIFAADDDEKKTHEAQDFYDKFLKKSLGAAFRAPGEELALDFANLKSRLEQKAAFKQDAQGGPDPEWVRYLEESAQTAAFEGLRSRRAVGRGIEISMARKIAAEQLEKYENFGLVFDGESEPIGGEFKMPGQTRGKRVLNDLWNKAEDGREHAKDSDLAAAHAEDAEVNYRLELGERERATGLLGRGKMFEAMESALEDNKNWTVVSIDMAFLKYFDREGGPKAGDAAIGKAAEILDQVAAQFSEEGVEVQAYRVGGDEFVLTIMGGTADLPGRVTHALEDRAREAGRVPGQEGVAKPSYQAEKLLFNYGVRTVESTDEFREQLAAAGIPSEPTDGEHRRGEKNYLAEMALRMADKELEIQKSLNRLLLLIGRRLKISEGASQGNYQAILEYSKKGIFGEEGTKFIDEMVAIQSPDAAAGQTMHHKKAEILQALPPEAREQYVLGAALEFVIEQIGKKNEEFKDFDMSMERRLEELTREGYFNRRIMELGHEISALKLLVAREGKRASELGGRLKSLESERDLMAGIRQKISANSPGVRQAA